MTPTTKNYVVLSDTGVILEGPDETVHQKGAVLALDPENEQVKVLLANDSIGEVMDDSELVDYIVTEEFLKENPAFAEQGIVVGDTIKVPKEVAEDVTADEKAAAEAAAAAAGAEQAAATDVEVEAKPAVLTFQGQEVVARSIRTVNEIDHVHYRLADGSEQDVTDEEDKATHAAAGIAL